ncbi:uncharacterized protein PSFLO_01737 [Pseudozyma flocculosa]|uniref:Uncharacterized protein n=1 Tax=Pseudozyma flocculosa TaxID=84751 RepID=A0A5C3EXD5_9BASI|nr:uncharacterized protein PSFLO_01737 [Pseudozyma flocculosa]
MHAFRSCSGVKHPHTSMLPPGRSAAQHVRTRPPRNQAAADCICCMGSRHDHDSLAESTVSDGAMTATAETGGTRRTTAAAPDASGYDGTPVPTRHVRRLA